MANELFPAGYDRKAPPMASVSPSASPVGCRGGIRFDEETGDFPRDGRNRLQDCSGMESWADWVKACLTTQRFQHLAYGPDFGIDWAAVFSAESRAEAESLLSRQIQEAISADPYGRTRYVSEILLAWDDPDSLRMTVSLQGIEDVTLAVTATMAKGGT